MTTRHMISAIALAAGLSAPGLAAADITADQAWQAIQDYAARSGQTVTGTPARTGSRLTVADVSMSMQMPDGSITGDLGELTFVERGDGAVEVTFPPEMPMTITGSDSDGETVEMMMTLRHDGLVTVVSGTPENITYDYAADRIGIDMDGIEVEGEQTDVKVGMSVEGLSGQYIVAAGDPMKVAGSFAARTADITVAGQEPGTANRFDMSVSATNIASSGTSSMPAGIDTGNLSAMLAAGFTGDGQLTLAGLDMEMKGSGDGDDFALSATTDGGALTLALGQGGISYRTEGRGIQMALSGSQIPFPELTAAIAQSDFAVTLPLTLSEESRDFALLSAYRGITVTDTLWNMIDPAGQLPRDPANLVIDLAGKARWLVDISNPEVMENLSAPPAELEALDINAVELSIAGAELTGTGSFTIDNTDTSSFPGMPAPEGKLNLRLVGGNALLDKLTQIGLVQQEQAMGARMMLGLFARPGDGPDTLVSEIEVRRGGSILANGQQIK